MTLPHAFWEDSWESTGNPGEHKASLGTPILPGAFPGAFLVDSWTVPSAFLGTPGMGQEYVRNVPGMCQECVRNVSGITGNLPGILAIPGIPGGITGNPGINQESTGNPPGMGGGV